MTRRTGPGFASSSSHPWSATSQTHLEPRGWAPEWGRGSSMETDRPQAGGPSCSAAVIPPCLVLYPSQHMTCCILTAPAPAVSSAGTGVTWQTVPGMQQAQRTMLPALLSRGRFLTYKERGLKSSHVCSSVSAPLETSEPSCLPRCAHARTRRPLVRRLSGVQEPVCIKHLGVCI